HRVRRLPAPLRGRRRWLTRVDLRKAPARGVCRVRPRLARLPRAQRRAWRRPEPLAFPAWRRVARALPRPLLGHLLPPLLHRSEDLARARGSDAPIRTRPGGAIVTETRRALVLGGSGYVGREVVRSLAAAGARVGFT